MKKVTLQEIANSLDISRTTVWKVFSGHDGVSDALRTKIITKAQELGYTFPENFQFPAGQTEELPINIAVTVCRPETSLFWMNIIHEIAKEFSHHNVNLVYTYLPTSADETYTLPPTLTSGTIQGMIVMNVYNVHTLRLLSKVPIPKVFLDTATVIPPSELNGDLILMENRTSVYTITRHLIEQGRKVLGFIGDINYAKSNYERYQGFLRAMEEAHIQPDPSMMLTDPIGIDTYREDIDNFLSSLPQMPKAFVCANDHVGCILMQLLLERGIQVPQDIAISGFDNNIENPLSSRLTTVQVFNRELGLRLATQILFRINHPDMPYEVIYQTTKVLFRSSTGDPESEN
ncbi:MAG: LacI family DNA-binding transcriptional regulator [Fusicatenibacter sp.]|nr:LacI family DNA-binding transcriptional regulator [Lachnospiraceae bacterium]MDY2937663.1 LacI family DNA-binding transcriptional regulator [Fusicatenibacter sp.]